MRPEKLFALFCDVTRLKGIGPSARKALARLFHGDESSRVILRDLVFHLPVGLIDRRNSPAPDQAKEGDIVTWLVTVESHHAPARRGGGKLPYKVICRIGPHYVTLVFFHARAEYIAQSLPAGAQRVVSGRFERYDYMAQITHPDIIAMPDELEKIQALEPVYPLTGGITNRHMSKMAAAALARLPELSEWLDPALLAQKQWPGWHAGLNAAHHPASPESLLPLSPERERLAYDELLANQLALAVVRTRLRRPLGASLPAGLKLRGRLLVQLPYRLTAGQEKVLAEIDADLASGCRMLRMLQGDVGSGKTVVAMLAALSAIEAGRQVALLVPTELLGRQHHAFFSRMLEPLGINVRLLIGGMKASEHAKLLTEIASDEARIVIGTHAIIQEKVVFRDLAFAIIDEQHRFGVAQRMALAAKSEGTHILVMTATPIPRTLAMTAFGDMDCSILDEKPMGRQPIDTRAIPLSRAGEVLEGIARAMNRDEKVYWICPLVEESKDEIVRTDLAAAQARYMEFTQRFKEKVGLVHGRMPSSERDEVMTGFARDRHNLLVATTVVEVGVDVPDATIIVIEHAERFGLAQLHQLRGRVGRSDKPSVCILLYADKCGETAKARLKMMRETNDGFRIAEEDLRLRGSGDILGIRQSGMPNFRFADLSQHYDLLRMAHDEAKLILHRDPVLSTPRGGALKHLLYLFGYDENIRFLGAG